MFRLVIYIFHLETIHLPACTSISEKHTMLIIVKLKFDIVPNRNNPSFSNKPSVLLSSYRCASLPSSGNKSFSRSELRLCDERRQLKKFFRQGRSRRINSMYSETFFKGDLIIKIFIVYIIRLNCKS